MRYLKGVILAGGLLLGMAGESNAQIGISIGNPYGQGLYGGVPGYGYGYNGLNSYYSSGYLGGPGSFAYSSGYSGLASPAVGAGGLGYGYRPYGYGGYGYTGYGYRNYGGFRPLRRVGRMFR